MKVIAFFVQLQQLEDACYLVVGTNKYWFDSFISRLFFTSNVRSKEDINFYIIRFLILCSSSERTFLNI